jgi:hypothetical protein
MMSPFIKKALKSEKNDIGRNLLVSIHKGKQ